MCGDATVAADVEHLTGGSKVALVFTSPPYGQQRDYGEAAKEKCQDWLALMYGVFANLPMADDGQVLVNLGLIHRDSEWVPYWEPWIEWMRTQGWRRFGWYVWDQGSGLPGAWAGHLAPSFEFVFHFNRASREAAKCVDKKPESVKLNYGTTMRNKGGGNTAKTNPEGGLNPHKIPDSVFRVTRAVVAGQVEAGHPAVFPIGLPSIPMEAWTVPGDACYEPFGGSGTTLISAARLGRRSFLMEIEPKFCDIILLRAAAEGLTIEKVTCDD
jgi:DNA modification methylase